VNQPDPFADFPPADRRKLNRALTLRTYVDLIGACEDDEFFTMLTAFALQEDMVEDPDLCDLERHRQTLIDFVKRLHGHRDAMEGCPWTRVPRDLGYYGHWATMTAGEKNVYGVLCFLVEPRSLITYATLETMAKMGGCAPETVSDNLTRLKKRGLIKRWCRKVGPDQYLWFTKLVPEAACESPENAAKLKQAVVPARV
jgi:hypothetical protein